MDKELLLALEIDKDTDRHHSLETGARHKQHSDDVTSHGFRCACPLYESLRHSRFRSHTWHDEFRVGARVPRRRFRVGALYDITTAAIRRARPPRLRPAALPRLLHKVTHQAPPPQCQSAATCGCGVVAPFGDCASIGMALTSATVPAAQSYRLPPILVVLCRIFSLRFGC